MAQYIQSCKKLVRAINIQHNEKITFSTRQFIGTEGLPHSYYVVSKFEYDPDRAKYISHDLFGSLSPVRVLLYLRDYLYTLEGKELPTNDAKWNSIRAKIKEKNG